MGLGNTQWARSALGYLLILQSITLWLLAPVPWWAVDWAIVNRALIGMTLIALAELSFYGGLWALPADEASQFYRWPKIKRGFRYLFG